MRYGRLTVVSTSRGKWGKTMAHCRCDCGQTSTVYLADMKRGKTSSCGCLRSESVREKNTTHGWGAKNKRPPEYNIWAGMKDRCTNPQSESYPNYGGRGIKVCDRWASGEGGESAFACFLADMGFRPSPQHTIDREDNNGDYVLENCKWATPYEQARNTRRNRLVMIDDEEMCLSDAVARFGRVGVGTVHSRIHKLGWEVIKAIKTPPLRPSPWKKRRVI